MNDAQRLYAVILGIRSCFHRLGAIGDAWHADLGITAAMRAVMESLYDNGPQTVPRIAREKMVTRQHIQTIADALMEKGLVSTTANPSHKRSRLIRLTGRGRRLFTVIREREKALLSELARDMDSGGLGATDRLLRQLIGKLEAKLRKGHGQ